jgi:hypothetical protein
LALATAAAGWPAGVGLNERANVVRRGAGTVERQGAVDGAQRRFVVLAQSADRKRGERQRRRVISAACDRGARVPNSRGTIGLVEAGAREHKLVAQRKLRVGRRVVGG